MLGARFLSGTVAPAGQRNPIIGREGDTPNVSRDLELETDLKQLANGTGALDPSNAALGAAGFLAGFGAGNLDDHHGILRNVVLGLIFAAVAAHDYGGGPLAERLAKSVDARYGYGYGLHLSLIHI